MTMGNLALVFDNQGTMNSAYDRQGKHRDAEDLHKQCLAMKMSVLGENHPDTLDTMHNLANTYKNQGKYRDAEVLYKQCLDKKKIVLGESHPATLWTLSNLAKLTKLKDSIQGKE